MAHIKKIQDLIKNKVLILDGACGTQLQKQGMPTGVSPEQWCLQNHKVLSAVHDDYVKAGADIIYSCTFGANQLKLAQYGLSNVFEINRDLVRLAKKSAKTKVLVAGDIGPLGHFVQPFGDIEFEQAVNIFKQQIKGLISGGADLLVIETMMDIQEARAALIAARELTDMFVMVTMTFETNGRTLNGTDPLSALVTLQSLGADAVGCNCSTGPQDMLKFIKAMRPYAKVPLVAKPNAGMPRLVNNTAEFDLDPKQFSKFAKDFVEQGVSFIGGCCGTTPEHIKQLKLNLKKVKPVKPQAKILSLVSSSRQTVSLDTEQGIKIIGERINPTGKKQLQQELISGSFSLLRQMAKEQETAGAHLLDVNCGVIGADEPKLLAQAIKVLSVSAAAPLVLDSSDPKAIEQALRIYPGRAMINSISGETNKLKKLLNTAAKYGAMFILLPITKKGVPTTFSARKKIILDILKQAKKNGFSYDDIVVDCLVMTISSDQLAAKHTLDTVSWCADVLKIRTVLGISNVSFGLPQRNLINSVFLSMAAAKGLNLAIINPTAQDIMKIRLACDCLAGHDLNAGNYIAAVSCNGSIQEKNIKQDLSWSEQVEQAVLQGNKDQISSLLESALNSGINALNLVQDTMIPAITKVGEMFDRKEYFLPQLIASAETMKIGFNYLEPKLKEHPQVLNERPIILLATVEGDIHDIGKNIVGLMLKNHGFNVIDLGKDISAEKIVEAIKRHKPRLVGLSALMTTTMVKMKEIIDLTKQQGLNCRFILGGAAVTSQYAESLGAQFARDSVEAVRVSKQIQG